VTDAGQPAVTYLARDDQGGLVVVEEYRARSGVLAFSNLYRLPPGHGAQRVDQVPGMRERMQRAREAPSVPNANPRAGSPELTSETPEGLPVGIPDPRGRFNTYTPTGRAVLVEPRVVSLRALVPSHDADGRLNPAYPHAEGVQPRDRSAAPSSEQVRQIVAGFQPERLLPNNEAGAGAPIVHPHDLVVESGNGRVMALMRVFRDPDLAHLRDAYLDALRRAGFDVEGIEEPVVVSARMSQLSPAERIAFVREANGRLAAAETLAEQARRDADAAGGLLPEDSQAATASLSAPTLRSMRVAWPESFPNVIDHGVTAIRRAADWAAAKTGDAEAAIRLVERLARPEAAARLREALAGQDAVLVTVRQAERGGGDNLIPAHFARWLRAETGLAVDEGIHRLNRTMRTDAGASERLVRRAAFTGAVEPGRAYVIVDDVVTQGGTVADLRGYIETQGGRVVLITALQAPGKNATVASSPAQVAALRSRFGDATEAWWKDVFGYDFSGLTASEARHLFRFGSAENLRSALEGLGALRAGPDDAGGRPGDAAALPGGGTEGGSLLPRPQGSAGGGVAVCVVEVAEPRAVRLLARAEPGRQHSR